jgi:hypothetical protein
MALCVCDGPPHPYEPSWCGIGREQGTGKPLGIRQRADGVIEVRGDGRGPVVIVVTR